MVLNINEFEFSERLLNPSFYKKFNTTRKLMEKKLDPDEFRYRGGLDMETYTAMEQRWQEQQQIMEDHKKEVINKYGSLKDAPLSLGPFEKIEPVVGTKNVLVLLTEFADVNHLHQPLEFEELLFNRGSGQSLRDYYLESSWDQLDLTGEVNDHWFKTAGEVSEYVDEAVYVKYPLSRKLVKETIMQAKNIGVDFKPFARNGKIEFLIIVYAGFGLDFKQSIKKYIRPHQGRLEEPLEVDDGIFVDNYVLVPERPLNLGSYCHEIGHLLGLPDLYNEYIGPIVGSWCLMSYGDHIKDGKTPAHPSAWCKVHLGWREPVITGEIPQLMDIPAVIDDDGVIYKIPVPGDEGEYFLLENRQQKGFDRNLPASGLLIWHIDENRCIHKAPNSDPKNLGIILEQSDGKNELQSDYSSFRMKVKEVKEEVKKNILGDEGDAYPGITSNRNFDEHSKPSSDSLGGENTGIQITEISDSDDLMQAQIGVKWGKHPLKRPNKNTDIMAWFIHEYLHYLDSQKENRHDKGFEDAKNDILANLKEQKGLRFYEYGYQLGYKVGYFMHRDRLKKFKK